MYFNWVYWFCILAAYVQINLVEYGHCVERGCSLVGPSPTDPKKLSLLTTIEMLKGKMFSVDKAGSKYTVSICSSIDGKDDNISATWTRTIGNITKTTVIGRYNATDIGGNGTADWTLLVYSSGDVITEGFCNGSLWRTLVFVKCDLASNNGKLDLLEESSVGCFVMFQLKSSATCPHSDVPHGLGKGTVILVLLLTALICYVLVGVAYRRLVAGAKGFEQIPNYQFWKHVVSWPYERIRGLIGVGSHEDRMWRPSETADEPLLSP